MCPLKTVQAESDEFFFGERLGVWLQIVSLLEGADELLGGYSRHRTARVKRGAEGTRSEMLKELSK